MEIAKIALTKKRLEAMPEPERTAVLLMGHASNEINLLRKFMLILVRHGQPESPIVDHIQAGQTVIVMRMLLGKCFEAWLMFTKRVQPLRDKYLAKVRPPFQAALKDLQMHFADGRMAAIRNQLSFHYGDDKNLIEANWRKIPEDDPWDFYLHDLNVNSFYYVSELVITGVLTQLAIPDGIRGKPSDMTEEAIGFAEACKLNNEISGKGRVVRRVSRRLGCGAGPASRSEPTHHVRAHRHSLLTVLIDWRCRRSPCPRRS